MRTRASRPTASPEAYRAFCGAARRFDALRPWTTMPEQPVAVLFPGETDPDFAIAMGAVDEFVGMGLLRGLRGLAWLLLTKAGDGDDDVREELDELAFSMGASAELSPWDRAQRKAAGMRARRGEAVASVVAKRPGLADATPTSEDLRRLTLAVDTFADAYAAGSIGRSAAPEGSCRTLVLPRRPGDGVAVESRTFAPTAWIEAPPVAPPAELRAARRGRGHWIAAARTLPATVRDDDRVLRTLLLIDAADGRILGSGVVAGAVPSDAAREFWRLAAASADSGLPARVTIANRRLHESTAAGLRALGIEALYDCGVPGLREMLDEMIGYFATGG